MAGGDHGRFLPGGRSSGEGSVSFYLMLLFFSFYYEIGFLGFFGCLDANGFCIYLIAEVDMLQLMLAYLNSSYKGLFTLSPSLSV